MLMAIDESTLAQRLGEVLSILGPLWPEAVPLLRHRNCFELLCSVILSAQCTDEQVNRVTPRLFARWPDAPAMAEAELQELESFIRSIGFWRVKARHLKECAALLRDRHFGAVPATMESLLELPGVGRKTANLVLSSCFGRPGIIVDTHVLRVMTRLRLSPKADPGLVETVIARHLPESDWTRFSHAVNRHGKFVCRARKPDCGGCPVSGICPSKGLGEG